MALPRYLTAHEVADILKVSYEAALEIIKDAGATKIRRLVRIEEEVLENYLASCRRPSARTSIAVPTAPDGGAISPARVVTSGSVRMKDRQTSGLHNSSLIQQLKAPRRKASGNR